MYGTQLLHDCYIHPLDPIFCLILMYFLLKGREGKQRTISSLFGQIQDLWNNLRLETKYFDAVKRQILQAHQMMVNERRLLELDKKRILWDFCRGTKLFFLIHNCFISKEALSYSSCVLVIIVRLQLACSAQTTQSAD